MSGRRPGGRGDRVRAWVGRVAHGAAGWIIGFTFGSLALAVPAFRLLEPIPWVTPNPAISILAIGSWIVLWPVISRRAVARAENPRREALALGATAVATSVALDAAVSVLAFRSGLGFFAFISIWVGYGLLGLIPTVVAAKGQLPRSAEDPKADPIPDNHGFTPRAPALRRGLPPEDELTS